NVFDDTKPALVVKHARELCEPGTQIVGDALGYPDSNLGFTLHRVLPAIWFFEADAEDADDRFAAHCGAELFGVLAIRPGSSEPAAGLAIRDERGREFADPLHVE